MIAEPNSSPTPTETPTPSAPASSFEGGPLSADELYQLTLYKWRYSLEAYGFDQQEVRGLMFMKWLYASRRVQG